MSRSQRSFNFSFPFLPRTNLCICPDLYPSFPHQRSEMELQAFQPFFVAVAIADKNLRRSRSYIPHVLNICTRAWKRLLFQVQCWAVDRTGAATLASTIHGTSPRWRAWVFAHRPCPLIVFPRLGNFGI